MHPGRPSWVLQHCKNKYSLHVGSFRTPLGSVGEPLYTAAIALQSHFRPLACDLAPRVRVLSLGMRCTCCCRCLSDRRDDLTIRTNLTSLGWRVGFVLCVFNVRMFSMFICFQHAECMRLSAMKIDNTCAAQSSRILKKPTALTEKVDTLSKHKVRDIRLETNEHC